MRFKIRFNVGCTEEKGESERLEYQDSVLTAMYHELNALYRIG